MPKELADRIQAISAKKGITPSECVRQALETALLSPSIRLKAIKALEKQYEKGIDNLRREFEHKIGTATAAFSVTGRDAPYVKFGPAKGAPRRK